MSVQLSPMSPRTLSVGASDDPYKKYWLAILIGFILTGAWLCLPIMETQVGSTHFDTSKPAVDPNAAQSLDSVDNPNGAQGFSVSMDGVKRKMKSDEPVESMLYSAPTDAVAAGAAASGAPLGSASGSAASLAQQLKDVGDKKAAASGWNEKAQRGFTAPHLGSSLSGVDSASGGAGASAGVSSFGSSNAQIGFGNTKGLHDDGSADKAVGGVAALRQVASLSKQMAANRSGDGAVSSGSRIFDGAKARAIGAPVGGAGAAGSYEALDKAPLNLKLNDPKLDSKEMKEPAAVDVPTAATNDMGKQLAMMAVSMIVGGAIGGTAGPMVMMMAQMMMQQQQAQAAEAKSQADLARAKAKMGS